MVFGSILIPTDGSERVKPAVERALDLARATGARVTALHVVAASPPALVDPAGWERVQVELRDASERALRFVQEQARARGVPVAVKVVAGQASDEIIREARHHDLVVMGTLGRTGLDHLLLGSVAEKVVRHASVPVLVIPVQRPTE